METRTRTGTAPAAASQDAMQRALDIIREEHWAIEFALQEMQAIVRAARGRHAPLDCEPLKAILHYLRAFPETLHHPKEEDYLFRLLRRRTVALDMTLAELQRHHAAGEKRLDRLSAALVRFDAGFPEAFGEFCALLDDYCMLQRRHMQLEEANVLPAARRHLQARDWEDIAKAFGENGDPRFDPVHEKRFQVMLAKISRLMPAEEIS
jgi:hemerythrin-like domain-containing protein